MPTIKEKYETLRSVLRAEDNSSVVRNVAYNEISVLNATVEGIALATAEKTLNDLQCSLRKLNQTIDGLNKDADKIKTDVTAAELTVRVLGSVEVP